jgi:hypothetical protein
LSSYIYLTLDTTPPDIEIITPNYTTTSANTEIRVVSNEPLEHWQDIYIIDSLNKRHDVTFRHEGDELVGNIYFQGYPLGMVTVYARVMDDVHNKSALVSKSMLIISEERLTISLSDSERNNVVIKNENAKDVMVVDGEVIELMVDVGDLAYSHIDLDDKSSHKVDIRSEEVK